MSEIFSSDSFIQFAQVGYLSVIKLVIILAFAVYATFALVVLTQIKRMFEVLSTGAKTHIYSISLTQVILSLVALLWAIVVL